MEKNQKLAKITGVLFIIGTVAGILSALVTGPILNSPDFLAQISANGNSMAIGALFVLVMGLALAMVPIVMYSIFKPHNKNLAIGYLVFRGALETILYLAMVISWLVLIMLSQHFAAAGFPEVSHYQTLAAMLVDLSTAINPILTIVFSLGALMFYTLWFKSNLVPRWLSVWGLIGTVLYLVVGVSAMFQIDLEFLVAPLALNEMVLAVWLIVKGFNQEVLDSTTGNQHE